MDNNWLNIAKNRVKKILRERRVCCEKQLEAKISEAGPYNLRAEPDFVSKALKILVESKEIKKKYLEVEKNRINFYLPKDFDLNLEDDKKRYIFITNLYKKYREIATNQEYCGYVLEKIVQKAVQKTKYHFLGGPGKSTNRLVINGREIKGDIDLILFGKGKEILGVECKNKREWFYSRAKDIWEIIEKCVNNKTLPVIMARKFSYRTRTFFKKLGILGFETHNQYFLPKLEEEMKDIRHKDGLGFADIRFKDKPEKRYITFFDSTVKSQEEPYRNKFFSYLDLLKEYSKQLSQEISYKKRESLFFKLLEDIGLVKKEENDFEEYYDDRNSYF